MHPKVLVAEVTAALVENTHPRIDLAPHHSTIIECSPIPRFTMKCLFAFKCSDLIVRPSHIHPRLERGHCFSVEPKRDVPE